MQRVEHDLTDDQWTALKVAWGGCAYCGGTGRPLQRDCVLALSRGGRYTLDNIAPPTRRPGDGRPLTGLVMGGERVPGFS
jgi:hypothetical protein